MLAFIYRYGNSYLKYFQYLWIFLPDTVATWFSVDPTGICVATLISERQHKDISCKYDYAYENTVINTSQLNVSLFLSWMSTTSFVGFGN